MAFSQNNLHYSLFLDSVAPQVPLAIAHDGSPCPLPVLDERTVELDWTLPMMPLAQEMCFRRLISNFERASALVPPSRKRYCRGKDSENLVVRMRCALFAQVKPYLLQELGPEKSEAMQGLLQTCTTADTDWNVILSQRPSNFCMSMLQTEREAAIKRKTLKDETQMAALQREKTLVRSARWKLFQTALANDQSRIHSYKTASAALVAAVHVKQVESRRAIVARGAETVAGYMSMHLRVLHGGLAILPSEVVETKTTLAALSAVFKIHV